MNKVKIYKPAKTSMQSGLGKSKNWVLEFVSKKSGVNPLMGWESSTHTLSEVKLEFTNKENAVKYAKKNKLDYEVIEPKIKKVNKKSYSDNFIK